jgi:hypothetical protein
MLQHERRPGRGLKRREGDLSEAIRALDEETMAPPVREQERHSERP